MLTYFTWCGNKLKALNVCKQMLSLVSWSIILFKGTDSIPKMNLIKMGF